MATRDDAQWQRLEQENAKLRAENAELRKSVGTLEAKMAELERQLGRNPRNSSMPPAAEGLTKPPAPNRAERRKAKRRPGKQPGDPGHHLAQVSDPDEVVPHAPEHCANCGGSLEDAEVTDVEIRQVFEVPRIRPHVTEHQLQKRRCSCGHETKAPAPPEATAPACYGPSIRALAVYFSVYQHVPYDRLAEIFADVLCIPVSVGAIKAMVGEAGGALGLFLSVIADLLRDAPAVHFDETGARVEGSLHWVHVACTSLYTLLYCHKKRGRLALDDIGIIEKMEHVETHVGYSRRNLLVPVPSFDSFAALNEYLAACCFADLFRRVRGKPDTKAERLEVDRAAMFALPSESFEPRRVAQASANTLSLVRFDRNDYSVPTDYAHHDVTCMGGIDRVTFAVGTETVATHQRCWDTEQVRFDPVHYLALLERKPGALDHARPLEGWTLPGSFAVLRRRLEADLGSAGTREFIKVLRLLEKADLAELTAAVEEALAIGATGSDAVACILYARAERPVPLFSLDGHPHLKEVSVESPDLSAYGSLTANG